MTSFTSSPDRLSPSAFRPRRNSRNILLAKAPELLAGSKASAGKLHCHDLWDRRMQKEAVDIMLRKNDSRVQKYRREMGKLLYRESSGASAQLSPRTACLLRPLKAFSKPSHTLSFDVLPRLCDTQLEATAGLRSSLDKVSTRLYKKRTMRHTMSDDMRELKEYVRDEVNNYKAQNCSLQLNHSATFKVANRKKLFGVQFYEAQRRRCDY